MHDGLSARLSVTLWTLSLLFWNLVFFLPICSIWGRPMIFAILETVSGSIVFFCNKVELIQCNVSSAITGWEANTNPDVCPGSSVCFATGPNIPQYAPYLNQAIFYMLVDTPVTTCIGATCFHIYIHAILSTFWGPLAYMHNSLIGLHLMVVKGILYFEYHKNTLKMISLCLTQCNDWVALLTGHDCIVSCRHVVTSNTINSLLFEK